MLQTAEFYEVMKMFEKNASNMYIRVGAQGFKKEDKNLWQKQCYYCDGEVNNAFKIYLMGYSFGKINTL